MEIIKLAINKFELKLTKSKLILSYQEDTNSFILHFENGVYKVIEKPGEYEFGGISIFAREQKKGETFSSRINYLSVGNENSENILFFSKDFTFVKEDLSEFAAINVIVSIIAKKDMVSSLLKHYTPEYFIVIDNPKDEEQQKDIKLLTPVTEASGSIKLASTEFNNDEDTITKYILLK